MRLFQDTNIRRVIFLCKVSSQCLRENLRIWRGGISPPNSSEINIARNIHTNAYTQTHTLTDRHIHAQIERQIDAQTDSYRHR